MATAHPLPSKEYVLWARYVSPHDGDSPHLHIFTPFEEDEQFEGRVRLARINCPELAAPGGPEATAFTSAWMEEARALVVPKWAAWPLRVQGRTREKYGRPLVEVWRLCDGANLSDDLLAAGHGAHDPTLLALPEPGT
jgi:endonuclease YncB( thermonuclease family)